MILVTGIQEDQMGFDFFIRPNHYNFLDRKNYGLIC